MKSKQRNAYLKRKYGITLKQYNEKLKAQDSRCELCGRHKSEFTRSLAVDHDHKSGRIRGLLCFTCNKLRVGRLTLDWAFRVYSYLLHYEPFDPEAEIK